jgi:GH25 family lysozyme M1 (1,4-beta-N-acetylmuramidase)
MSKKIIDVSSYQGSVNWTKVKNAGVQGAIIKVIRKDLDKDNQFEANWTGCEKANMPIYGVYNYSYATTTTKAVTDAKAVIKALNGRKTKVWLDVEDNCQKKLGKRLIDIINAYKTEIENAGLEFGVYTGLSFYNSHIKPYAGYIKCSFWIARYPSTAVVAVSYNPSTNKQPSIHHVLEGWQYSSKTKVDGISGYVDMNIWYGDIPKSKDKPSSNNYPIPTRLIYYRKPILMKGEDVKWIQYHLVRLGFLAEFTVNKRGKKVNNIDGIAGSKFEVAVMKAQEHYGVKVDGKVGSQTREVLRWN